MIDYLELIDNQYKEAIALGINRYDQKWSLFSAEMNREIRAKIESNHPNSLKLKYIFVYWITISQLLQLKFRYRGKPYGHNKVKKKAKEAIELKNVIINGLDVDPLGLDIEPNTTWQDLASKLLFRLSNQN